MGEPILKRIFNLIYPIGSIYFTVANKNPSTLFGGTWVEWGKGRVPVGIDTNDENFNLPEKNGGTKAHTLTVNEMPSHKHTFDYSGEKKLAMVDTGINDESWGVHWETQKGYRCSTAVMDNIGGGQSHNNLQPYICCYMWKRIA